jgi:hypothetical protein
LAKTFRAHGTNFLHQEKSLRDQRVTWLSRIDL